MTQTQLLAPPHDRPSQEADTLTPIDLYEALVPNGQHSQLLKGEHTQEYVGAPEPAHDTQAIVEVVPDRVERMALAIGPKVMRLFQGVKAYGQQLGNPPATPPKEIADAPEIADYMPHPGSVMTLRAKYGPEYPKLPVQRTRHRANR